MEFLGGRVELHAGDCLDVVKTLADDSIDAVVTDPPYALVSIVKRFGKTSIEDANDTGQRSKTGADGYARLAKGFMGKEWDNGATAFAVDFWAEILRVLKPGGHVVAFGGTRSYHRLACAIEDAGFEIRDQLAWAYGTGFPKSHDVSKGIDKAAGAKRDVISSGAAVKRMIPGADQNRDGWEKTNGREFVPTVTAAATDAARQWEGWGTALKPAWEPICLARKPLSESTVAANVLRWGTGAINIDATRVGTDENNRGRPPRTPNEILGGGRGANLTASENNALGRWPANLAHDGSPEVLAAFPDSAGQNGLVDGQTSGRDVYGEYGPRPRHEPRNDSGSAARFFYSAKASKHDRAGSKHPTVKPVALMRWLCRLITPPGGVILDPFAGSGTTGAAAYLEDFDAVLIERELEYCDGIENRLNALERPVTWPRLWR